MEGINYTIKLGNYGNHLYKTFDNGLVNQSFLNCYRRKKLCLIQTNSTQLLSVLVSEA